MKTKQMMEWMEQNGVMLRAVKYSREGFGITEAIEQAIQDLLTLTEEMAEHKTERANNLYDAMAIVVYNQAKNNPQNPPQGV